MSSVTARIRTAKESHDIAAARELFVEYATWLGVDLCFQGFNEELATLPGKYAEPAGRLFVAETADGEIAGCVALRPLAAGPSGESCELKRLWVRPAYRKLRLGHTLTQAALDAARDIGYRSMKLDTLPQLMPKAVELYRSFGFVECAPYYSNPIQGTLYMERVL